MKLSALLENESQLTTPLSVEAWSDYLGGNASVDHAHFNDQIYPQSKLEFRLTWVFGQYVGQDLPMGFWAKLRYPSGNWEKMEDSARALYMYKSYGDLEANNLASVIQTKHAREVMTMYKNMLSDIRKNAPPVNRDDKPGTDDMLRIKSLIERVFSLHIYDVEDIFG